MLRSLLTRVASAAPAALTNARGARGAKRSTFLKGLEVDPEAAANLPARLQALLEQAQERLPVEAAYRAHVEGYCRRFMRILAEAPSQADAEAVLGRQFEEIQIDVDKESQLVDEMAQWRPWDTREGHVPRVFAQLTDIPSNVRDFREFQHELGSKEATAE